MGLFTLLFTVFIVLLVPIYWRYYGVTNFLWLSDVGLFLTLGALWLQSPLLMSMAAVGILVLEFVWWVDFFAQLIFGPTLINLASYMFDTKYPLFLRAISLFHLVTPMIWLVYLTRWGYDSRALFYMTLLYWGIILTTYLVTKPRDSINWVFMPQVRCWNWISSRWWLLILAVGFPLCVFLPTHLVYKLIFSPAGYLGSWL